MASYLLKKCHKLAKLFIACIFTRQHPGAYGSLNLDAHRNEEASLILPFHWSLHKLQYEQGECRWSVQGYSNTKHCTVLYLFRC